MPGGMMPAGYTMPAGMMPGGTMPAGYMMPDGMTGPMGDHPMFAPPEGGYFSSYSGSGGDMGGYTMTAPMPPPDGSGTYGTYTPPPGGEMHYDSPPPASVIDIYRHFYSFY